MRGFFSKSVASVSHEPKKSWFFENFRFYPGNVRLIRHDLHLKRQINLNQQRFLVSAHFQLISASFGMIYMHWKINWKSPYFRDISLGTSCQFNACMCPVAILSSFTALKRSPDNARIFFKVCGISISRAPKIMIFRKSHFNQGNACSNAHYFN